MNSHNGNQWGWLRRPDKMCCLCAPTLHRASNGNLHQAIYQTRRTHSTRQNAFESSSVVLPSLNGHILNPINLDEISIFTSGSLQPIYFGEKVSKFRYKPCSFLFYRAKHTEEIKWRIKLNWHHQKKLYRKLLKLDNNKKN